jgi:hypothetical protein
MKKKKNNESDFFCWEKHDDIRSGSVARKAKKCQKYKFGIKKILHHLGDNGQKRLNKIRRHFPGNCFSR